MSFAAYLEQIAKPENPYPGLRPFEPEDAPRFFGRDEQIRELVQRLKRHRLVAVVGWSGSGKSSLVKAGLIPMLEEGAIPSVPRWRVLMVHPGDRPVEELLSAVESADVAGKRLNGQSLRESSLGLVEVARQLPLNETLLVVVDQFEELFRFRETQHRTEADEDRVRARADEAAHFVQLLLTAAEHEDRHVYVILTMRSDYLGDCAEFRGLPEALNDAQYLVPRLTREQRRQAIQGPLGEVRITSALVQRLVNEVGDEPDQLPLLQHALMRVWSQWRGEGPNTPERPIEVSDYDNDRIGGLHEALNRHAEELCLTAAATKKAMWPNYQGELPTITETIFKRLTAIGRGRRERRDPAHLEELWAACGAEADADRVQVNDVVQLFRQAGVSFLSPRDGDLRPDTVIDITHESLIRQWKRLKEWAESEDESSRALLTLAQRSKGELLTGTDLEQAQKWCKARNPAAAWAEHYQVDPIAVAEYVLRSENVAKYRRDRDAETDRELKAATQTRLLILKWAALTLLGCVLLAGWFAIRLSAEKERAYEAEERANRAEAKANRELELGNDRRLRAELAEAKADVALTKEQLMTATGDTKRDLEKQLKQQRERADLINQQLSKAEKNRQSPYAVMGENRNLRQQVEALQQQVEALKLESKRLQGEKRDLSQQVNALQQKNGRLPPEPSADHDPTTLRSRLSDAVRQNERLTRLRALDARSQAEILDLLELLAVGLAGWGAYRFFSRRSHLRGTTRARPRGR